MIVPQLTHSKSNPMLLALLYDALGTGASFGMLRMEHVSVVKRIWPSDFEKIKAMYPLIEAQVLRWEEEQRQASETTNPQAATAN